MRKTYAIFIAPETVRDTIAQIFTDHKAKHGDYPTSHEIDALARTHSIIPTMRTIQNRGGVRRFYETGLRLPYIDARTGDRRGALAQTANLRALADEDSLSSFLVKTFGESNVHHRSPYPNQTGTWMAADFKVYTGPKDFFFIDVFSATGIMNLTGCVNIKIAKLARAGVGKDVRIFFVSCSDSTSQYQIDEYVKAKKKPLPKNVRLMDINTAVVRFKDMAPVSVV